MFKFPLWGVLCLLFLAGCGVPTYYLPPEPPAKPKLEPPPPKPKFGLIVIDAGHGGQDQGTQSNSKPIYTEKSVTLSTARLLKGFLNQMGYQTLMTRDKDVFIPLADRSALANDNGATLFVSVHFNSAPSTDADGIEIFYYDCNTSPKRTRDSKKLADMVLRSVLKSTQARSRGVKQGNLAVVRETTMPAILIEGGFMTNNEEMIKIKDPAYLKKLAWGIAQGIDAYLTK